MPLNQIPLRQKMSENNNSMVEVPTLCYLHGRIRDECRTLAAIQCGWMWAFVE